MRPQTREILRIALPAAVGYLGIMAYDIIDMFWIARLGREAVAGAASAGFCLWTVEAFMEMTTIGCATLTAQAIGAGRGRAGRMIFKEAAQASVLISATLVAVALLLAPKILSAMGLTGAALFHGTSYLRVNALGFPVLHGILLMKQVFNAHGDTKTETLVMAGALTVNAILDPFLIFGWGPFPQMGVAGAAIATIVGLCFGLVTRFFILRRRWWIGRVRDLSRITTSRTREILRIGIPTAVVHAIWTMSYPLLTSVITRFGVAPLAGMSIAHRFEGFAYFTTLGFSVAMATLVGQRVGAGKLEEARAFAYEGRRIISLILLPASLFFVLAPEILIGLLSPDSLTTEHGIDYLRVVGAFTIFLGWELSFEGAFNGLGNTRPYMFFSVPLTLARWPVSYILVVHAGFGVEAVWWTIAGSTLIKALTFNRLFARTAPA